MKACTKCGNTKELKDFPRRNRNADGRDSICRACKNPAKVNQCKKKNLNRKFYEQFMPV